MLKNNQLLTLPRSDKFLFNLMQNPLMLNALSIGYIVTERSDKIPQLNPATFYLLKSDLNNWWEIIVNGYKWQGMSEKFNKLLHVADMIHMLSWVQHLVAPLWVALHLSSANAPNTDQALYRECLHKKPNTINEFFSISAYGL